MSHHPNNLKLQPYDHAKLIELAEHAERLGIQFKIAGIPFGANYDHKLWDDFYGQGRAENAKSTVGTGGKIQAGKLVGLSAPAKRAEGEI